MPALPFAQGPYLCTTSGHDFMYTDISSIIIYDGVVLKRTRIGPSASDEINDAPRECDGFLDLYSPIIGIVPVPDCNSDGA